MIKNLDSCTSFCLSLFVQKLIHMYSVVLFSCYTKEFFLLVFTYENIECYSGQGPPGPSWTIVVRPVRGRVPTRESEGRFFGDKDVLPLLCLHGRRG